MAFGLILMFGRASLALSAMYWLASLFLLCAAGCVIVTATAKSTKKKLMPKSPPLFPPTFIPEVQRRGKVTVWIGLMLAIPLIAALGGVAGYGIRDHQLATHIVPYTDVLILPPSQPGDDFDIQPARMKPIPSKLCQSIVDWKFGDRLDDLVFEQKKGCKRVISYHPSSKKGEVANAE